jgi:hypothetical protein
LPKKDFLKECYFDVIDGTYVKKNPASVTDSDITESNGFECGELYCHPIETFCLPSGIDNFELQEFCPGF